MNTPYQSGPSGAIEGKATMFAPGTHPNIAESLAELLPHAEVAYVVSAEDADQITHVAVPKGTTLQKLDFEELLPHPRRTKAKAKLQDAASFLAYVKRHETPATVVWCAFDPRKATLSFTAVFDDHENATAGWRSHQASFTPETSIEWTTWVGANANPMSQLDFAEFLERNEPDIAKAEGMPTSLDMMKMATNFSASSEKRVKSVIRLQSGGFQLECVDDEDTATTSRMQAFEKFTIGIPVFYGSKRGFHIPARLKYQQGSGQNAGKVSFRYELIRQDRVHETAARELIGEITAALGPVSLFMGDC